jgi:hypothetical protein
MQAHFEITHTEEGGGFLGQSSRELITRRETWLGSSPSLCSRFNVRNTERYDEAMAYLQGMFLEYMTL